MKHPAVLPDKDMLLAACRGFPQLANHPMLTAAAELAVLHQTREHTPHSGLAAIDRHRTLLMERIDTWVITCVPHPKLSARVHTHTMGQVIDRIAQLTSYTYTLLSGASDAVFFNSAAYVEELAHGYEDLCTELAAGVRRLPVIAVDP